MEETFLGCDVDPLWRGNGYMYMERIQMFLLIIIISFLFFSFFNFSLNHMFGVRKCLSFIYFYFLYFF